jgi:hypothetical protein
MKAGVFAQPATTLALDEDRSSGDAGPEPGQALGLPG